MTEPVRYRATRLYLSAWGVWDAKQGAHLCQDGTTRFSVSPANLTWSGSFFEALKLAEKRNKEEAALAVKTFGESLKP